MAANFVKDQAMLLATKKLVWSRRAVKVTAMQAMALLVVSHLPGIFFHCLNKGFGQFDFLEFALEHPAQHKGFDFGKHIYIGFWFSMVLRTLSESNITSAPYLSEKCLRRICRTTSCLETPL